MNWIAITDEDEKAMLTTIGVNSIDDLFDVIPEELRLKDWEFPPGRSEMATESAVASLAARNRTDMVSFLGGGYYDHYIPAAIDALASRGEFLTAYTPYQPECAQGTLQAVYEYQSAICRLTGMEFANASLYDGGTAVFEAATMALRLTRRAKVVCHPSLNPLYRRMLETHIAHLDVELANGDDPADAACLIVQNPDYRGTLHDFTEIGKRCHEAGALLVVSFYPISLGIVKTPGEMGADIAIAEGQSLGMPLAFGGPYLGVLATTRRCVRKIPGRIAAATTDAEGNPGYVLTLQAREQHIRREKAMSNICSNEALCALRTLIYLCLQGKEGLRDTARQCHAKAEYLKEKLAAFLPVVNDGPTFNEFVIRLPRSACEVVAALLERNYCAGLPLNTLDGGPETDLLVAVTEKRSREEMDRFAQALKEESCN